MVNAASALHEVAMPRSFCRWEDGALTFMRGDGGLGWRQLGFRLSVDGEPFDSRRVSWHRLPTPADRLVLVARPADLPLEMTVSVCATADDRQPDAPGAAAMFCAFNWRGEGVTRRRVPFAELGLVQCPHRAVNCWTGAEETLADAVAIPEIAPQDVYAVRLYPVTAPLAEEPLAEPLHHVAGTEPGPPSPPRRPAVCHAGGTTSVSSAVGSASASEDTIQRRRPPSPGPDDASRSRPSPAGRQPRPAPSSQPSGGPP